LVTIAACYVTPEGVVLEADPTASLMLAPGGFHYFNYNQTEIRQSPLRNDRTPLAACVPRTRCLGRFQRWKTNNRVSAARLPNGRRKGVLGMIADGDARKPRADALRNRERLSL
jgi:hypothetical protein